MVVQLRTYSIQPGMLPSWLSLFRRELVPLHASIGMPVRDMWVDEEANQFVWTRVFDSADSIAAKEEAFVNSERVTQLAPELKRHIAGYEVRLLTPVEELVAVGADGDRLIDR